MSWTYTVEELAEALGGSLANASSELKSRSFSAISTDSRTIDAGQVFFALSGENFDGNQFAAMALEKGAVAAVVSNGTGDPACLVVDDVLQALQHFANYHRRRFTMPVLGLTGSCGKTTSKDMISALLSTRFDVVKTQGNFNNEIGCPLSLMQLDQNTGFAVIEMGANHMGEIAALGAIAEPTEAAITMVGPSHLEGFGSIENIATAKGEIVDSLKGHGVFYVNADDPFCCDIARAFAGDKVRFGSEGDVVLESCEFDATSDMVLDILPIGKIRLPLLCRAHASNVLLAVSVGLQHGITDFEQPLRQALDKASRFKVQRIGPLFVIDDTYNANPASMKASLDALVEFPQGNARIAALGDMFELGDSAAQLHREVGQHAGRAGLACLLAMGPHACDTINGAKSSYASRTEVMEEHQSVAEEIIRTARADDVVLVKGSRGMRMEKVVELLRKHYEGDAVPQD